MEVNYKVQKTKRWITSELHGLNSNEDVEETQKHQSSAILKEGRPRKLAPRLI